jgi:hypothetical protein
MTSANGNTPSDPDQNDDDLELDLDLDAEDAVLKADIGESTRVKITGHVIDIPHMDLWDYEYARRMSSGDFTGWARGVLSDEDFDVWMSANLKNYQIQAIVAKVTVKGIGNLAGKNGLGKSSQSSRSSARKRKR